MLVMRRAINRVIVGALFTSFCFLFSICLTRARNSVGVHAVLRILQEGVARIHSQGFKKMRDSFHQFAGCAISMYVSLQMPFALSQRKRS